MQIEKRVKRQIIGKVHNFLCIVPLGFENTFIKELKILNAIKISDGKVQFSEKIICAWNAIAHTRIANKILMQIAEFKAENFITLNKRAANIPWEIYLPQKMNLQIHVTCKHSRLYHSDAIKERLETIIASYFNQNFLASNNETNLATNYIQNIYVEFLNDKCTLWLDLAGEALYKRGFQKFVDDAPLKETIAAAIILEAEFLHNTPNANILDAMAGSGTFSQEAALISNNILPGNVRDFSLKYQPAFKQATWNFLTKNVEQNSPKFSTITASDISIRAVKIMSHNIQNLPLNKNCINFLQKDFFSYNKILENTIIFLNPPYGKRLHFNAPELYKKIGLKLTEICAHTKNITVAILAPKDLCTKNLLETCSKIITAPNAKKIETSHGGISLNVFFAKLS